MEVEHTRVIDAGGIGRVKTTSILTPTLGGIKYQLIVHYQQNWTDTRSDTLHVQHAATCSSFGNDWSGGW